MILSLFTSTTPGLEVKQIGFSVESSINSTATSYPIILCGSIEYLFEFRHPSILNMKGCVLYPIVLLGVPLWAEGVERLAPLGAVGELKEARESASVLGRVKEDGILEVDTMWADVVVLVQPAEEINSGEKLKLLQDFFYYYSGHTKCICPCFTD